MLISVMVPSSLYLINQLAKSGGRGDRIGGRRKRKKWNASAAAARKWDTFSKTFINSRSLLLFLEAALLVWIRC